MPESFRRDHYNPETNKVNRVARVCQPSLATWAHAMQNGLFDSGLQESMDLGPDGLDKT